MVSLLIWNRESFLFPTGTVAEPVSVHLSLTHPTHILFWGRCIIQPFRPPGWCIGIGGEKAQLFQSPGHAHRGPGRIAPKEFSTHKLNFKNFRWISWHNVMGAESSSSDICLCSVLYLSALMGILGDCFSVLTPCLILACIDEGWGSLGGMIILICGNSLPIMQTP